MDSTAQTSADLDKIEVAQALMCRPEDCYIHLEHSTSYLTVLTQNIRSIYKNLDAFQVTLDSLKFDSDILVMTECHITDNKSIPILNSNYNTHYTTKNQNRCDGVILYVKKSLSYKVTEPYISNASCLVITFKDVILIGIYRTPSIRSTQDFTDSLQKLLHSYKNYKNVIITGDINIDIKDNSIDPNCSHYLTSLSYFGLLPAHRLDTRNDKCYDHFMLKTVYPAKCLVLTNAPTDHSTVILNLMINLKRNAVSCYKISFNYDATIADIKNNLCDILDIQDPNLAVSLLSTRISEAMNKHKTVSSIPRRKRCIQPWITPGVLRCIRNRDKLHLKVKKHADDQILKITYTRYRNFCHNLICKLKNNYDKNKLENSNKNCKTLWKSIKSICNLTNNKSVDSHKLENISSSPVESANFINYHFANIGRSLAENINKPPFPTINPNLNKISPANSFVLLKTDASEVNYVITNLSNDSAPGSDNIPNSFIKRASHILTPILCHIYNLCFEKGIFPSVFKKAIVTPIYKSGNKEDVNNYRPISVLPALSKILEKLINYRLRKFFADNDLLSKNQFGFRNGISSEDAVLALTEEICYQLDSGNKCLGVFLDLSKAFDTVSIPILLEKLYHFGIRGVPHSFLSDYLTDRQQQLKLGQIISSPTNISYGIPQGSVLGPTLFLIYVNELCNFNLPNCKIFTYADDTALVFNANSWENIKVLAESGMHYISSWLRGNLLTLNISKTKFVPFSIRKTSLPPSNFSLVAHSCLNPTSNTCLCNELTQSNNIKYLGVFIDQHLTWNIHINSIADRIRKLIWIFKRLRHVASKDILIMTYKALAQSIISYGIPVWGGAAKSHLIILERAQRALLKVMFFKPIRYPTFELYNSLELLTTRQMYILNCIMKTHQQLPYTPQLASKRRKFAICSAQNKKTKFRHIQFTSQSSHLYNSLNSRLNVYPLTRIKLRQYVTKYLLSLNYSETENLIY
ncbi:uncharacterized protein [Epargyreus clarus]|uniref:uncharacterized protein n=1 Tax=Epargyreus clarus TaxID=520877 RepID=UPI003C2E4867